MQKNSLTLSEALAAGYTHFWISLRHHDDEFDVFPLTEEKLRWAIRRCTDADFDLEEGLDITGYFGGIPTLCDKGISPEIDDATAADKITDVFEDDDRFAPAVLSVMFEHLKNEEKFTQGVALINEAMAQYRSFSSADIAVTID